MFWNRAFTIILAILTLLPLKPDTKIAQTEPSAQRTESGDSTRAVLVELFTSEGCSSCPPADKLLSELDRYQPVPGVTVIALSEHVDYWNRLGWKDPFSSSEFSRRQMDYARALNIEDFYTPQMIVDGRTEFVGSKRATALEVIAKAARSPKATVNLTLKPSAPNSTNITIQIEDVPGVTSGDRVDVMLAVAEDRLLNKVTRGENAGRELSHAAVTRKLTRLASVNGQTFRSEQIVRLDPAWKPENTKIVIFVQERTTYRVLGAAVINLRG